jgi:hypothetical protein
MFYMFIIIYYMLSLVKRLNKNIFYFFSAIITARYDKKPLPFRLRAVFFNRPFLKALYAFFKGGF